MQTLTTAAGRRWILVATILGSSMSFIDGTVVNIALPAMQTELHASLGGVQWVVEAYLVALGSLLMLGGSMGDVFGRRRMYILGVVLFTVWSMACGLAQTLQQLVTFRALQGVGAALLVPGSMAILSDVFEGNERGQAIGTWSAFSSVTTAIGPVLGGYLVQYWSWRWAFMINLPIGIGAVVLLSLHLKSIPPATERHLDLAGAAWASVCLASLVFALIALGTGRLTDASVCGPLVMALVCLGAFISIERRSPDPMVPLSLFTSRAFSGASLMTLMLYAGLTGVLFFLPLDLIQIQHFSATQAGCATLPMVGCLVLLSKWAGELAARHGPRTPLTVGALVAAVGFGLFAVPGTEAGYWSGFFPAALVLGLGMSLVVAPLTIAVMASVDPAHFGSASGINNAISRVAGMVAIATMGLVMTQTFHSHLEAAHASAEILRHSDRLGAVEVAPGSPMRRVVDEAFVGGFRAVSLACAGLALFGAGLAYASLVDLAASGTSVSTPE